jgi:hypothetical protein
LIEQIKRLCQPAREASKAASRHANEVASKLLADTDRILQAIAALLGESAPETNSCINVLNSKQSNEP